MASVESPRLPSEEPIGIVISRGTAVEALPRVVAYVWAEAPAGDAAPAHVKSP